jgi:hypothetical protein
MKYKEYFFHPKTIQPLAITPKYNRRGEDTPKIG